MSSGSTDLKTAWPSWWVRTIGRLLMRTPQGIGRLAYADQMIRQLLQRCGVIFRCVSREQSHVRKLELSGPTSSLPLSSANDPKRIVLLAGHGALPARVSVNRPGNESGQRKRHQRDAHPALYFIDLRPRCKCLLKARSKTCPRLSRKAHNPSIRTVSSAFWVPESSAREAKGALASAIFFKASGTCFIPAPSCI